MLHHFFKVIVIAFFLKIYPIHAALCKNTNSIILLHIEYIPLITNEMTFDGTVMQIFDTTDFGAAVRF